MDTGEWILEAMKKDRNTDEHVIATGMYLLIVLICLIVLLICVPAHAVEYTDDQIANAIFKAENSAKYPYGIKSIDTHGDAAYARRICLNTIKNNRRRFTEQAREGDFIVFLGSRFCPPAVHPLNSNWVRNVKYFLQAGAI